MLGRRPLIVLLVAAIIIYGSLYPFAFHWPDGSNGPIRSLLNSWSQRPGRGDFLANILLYMPFGFFAIRALPRTASSIVKFGTAIALGAGLSIAIELAQYFDIGRRSAAVDVYANILGTAAGAVIAGFARLQIGSPATEKARHHTAPLLLLAAWAADRLFPFIPVIDLHKYWTAVKPLFIVPHLNSMDLFRHAAIWSAVFVLLDEVTEGTHSIFLFSVFAFALATGQIFVVGGTLSWPEMVGTASALIWALATTHFSRVRIVVVAILLGAYILAERLQPFTFSLLGKQFGWVPFLGFLKGSITVDVLSFLEKSFCYGALIWIMVKIGMRIWGATFLVGGALFLTSVAQVYLPGRSAEITDALIAVAAGALFSLLADYPVRTSAGGANDRRSPSTNTRGRLV